MKTIVTREHKSWDHMIQRCTNPKNHKYPSYGGRGIRVCAEWRDSFEAFFDCVGPKPTPKHTIDRVETDGHYEPGNVRWATKKEQSSNRRPRPPTEVQRLVTELGVSPRTLRKYLRQGIAPEAIKTVMGTCHCSKCGAAGHQARSCGN